MLWPSHVQARSANQLPSYATQAPINQAAHTPANGLTGVDARNATINLWQIEERQQTFSHTVLSPNRRAMAFTEAVYLPPTAQVLARLYMAPLVAPPSLATTHQLPEDYYVAQIQQEIAAKRLAKADKKARTTCRFWVWCKTAPKHPQPHPTLSPANPNARVVMSATPTRSQRQGFDMIIPVDWAQDSQTLLVKHTRGQLYQGITYSEPVTLNAVTQQPVYYPELSRAVRYYWQQQAITPTLDEINWLIDPIGWAPGSSTQILNEVWGYLPDKRLFLGLWAVDIHSRQVSRLSLQYNSHYPVASNGSLVSSQ